MTEQFVSYGVPLTHKLPPPIRELFFFRHAPSLIESGHQGYTGEGRLFHCKQFAQMTWGKTFSMNEWAEDQLDMFSSYKWSTVTGPAAGGKTTAAAIYALQFWLCDPLNTAVIVTSTTVPGLRRRIWKEIKRYWQNRACQYSDTANLVESKLAIQSEKNDDGNGIFGIAVAAGQTEKALGRIIGFHPKRLLIIVDEMTDTPEAIVDACVNLEKTEGEFQFIGIGNAKSIFDPHGAMSEPKAGWKSITVESEFWETERGACLHLDGLKSPNIKAGKPKFPYLIKQTDIDSDRRNYGDNSPKFWRFCRGFWAPQGLSNTVLSEQMLIQYDPRRQVLWRRGFTNIAALDVSLGGDRCVLKFGRYGQEAASPKTVIELRETIPIEMDAGSNEPLHFQIARQVIFQCKVHGVRPDCFGLDATGLGSGTADILQREWSHSIHRVEFGTSPTERVVSDTNSKTCKEEYFNFVTELWFAFRLFVEGDQIRNLQADEALEFCSRQWEQRGDKIKVESKEDMKDRMNKSPDLADADVILVEVARRHGVNPAGFTQAAEGPDAAAESRRRLERARVLDFDSQETYLDLD